MRHILANQMIYTLYSHKAEQGGTQKYISEPQGKINCCMKNIKKRLKSSYFRASPVPLGIHPEYVSEAEGMGNEHVHELNEIIWLYSLSRHSSIYKSSIFDQHFPPRLQQKVKFHLYSHTLHQMQYFSYITQYALVRIKSYQL